MVLVVVVVAAFGGVIYDDSPPTCPLPHLLAPSRTYLPFAPAPLPHLLALWSSPPPPPTCPPPTPTYPLPQPPLPHLLTLCPSPLPPPTCPSPTYLSSHPFRTCPSPLLCVPHSLPSMQSCACRHRYFATCSLTLEQSYISSSFTSPPPPSPLKAMNPSLLPPSPYLPQSLPPPTCTGTLLLVV